MNPAMSPPRWAVFPIGNGTNNPIITSGTMAITGKR